jgi:hypothetical protein
MRKATILFNPNSGRRGKKRDAELNHAIGILQSAGVHTDLTVCRSSQEATDNAPAAPWRRAAIPFSPAAATAPSTTSFKRWPARPSRSPFSPSALPTRSPMTSESRSALAQRREPPSREPFGASPSAASNMRISPANRPPAISPSPPASESTRISFIS